MLGHYLSWGKPLLTLATLHTLNLTVSSSLVLQGLGPTSESLATNTALVRPLVLSAGSSATSNGWWRLCWNHTGHTRGCTAGLSDWAGPVAFLLPYPAQSLRIVVQFKVRLVWLQHNRHHQITDAPDAALGQAAVGCSICGQAFRSQPQALEHKANAHSGVKSVECDQCEERFTSRERLAKHRESRHSNQSHPCAECDKTFVCKFSLRSHKRKVHTVEYGSA